VRKKRLFQEQKVSDADAVVSEASGWAGALLSRVYRGPGDTIEAAAHSSRTAIRRPGADILGAPVSEAQGHAGERLCPAQARL
jgi:hypothetical protein